MAEQPEFLNDSANREKRVRWVWRLTGLVLWGAVLGAGYGIWRSSLEYPAGHSVDTAAANHNITAPAESTESIYPRKVEDFALTERSGRTVTRADLLGRPWVACFLFTRCAGPCPKLAGQVKLLQEEFKGTDVHFVTFSVDPEYDTPERLVRYAEAIGADADRWLFLTGDKSTIYNLIAASFRMPVGTRQGEIMHSTNLMLVDAAGQVVAKYNGLDEGEVVALKRALHGREPHTPK
jgi:protein SCO1/2/putative membrane protein